MAEEFSIPHACRTASELIALSDVDLVVITSPPVEHRHATLAALEAGKHVICEKPMAMSATEAREMKDAALARPAQLSIIDHELRFNPTWRRMKQLVADGFAGNVFHVNFTVATGFRHSAQRPWNWWAQRSAGGGLLGALGSHAIDALRWLLGDIESVASTVATMVPGRMDTAAGKMRSVETDDYCAFLVRFAQREERVVHGVVTLSAVIASGGKNQIVIAGDRGTLILEADETLLGASGYGATLEDLSVKDPARDIPSIPGNIWARSFYHLAGATLDALLKGSSTVEGAATFADGWRCQQVIDAVNRGNSSAKWESTLL
jgi:predicted dehydrogenase